MPSNKRWGEITVTKMPVPEGKITSSEIFATPEVIVEPVIPEEPTEIEQKEEERENED